MSAKLLFEMADLEVEKQLAVWIRKERRGRYRAIVPGPGCHALLQNSATLDMRLAEDIYPSGPTEVVEILRRAGAPETCYAIAYKLEGEHVELTMGVEAVWGVGGFVSCLHGRLAYVELKEWETMDLIFRR